MRRAVGLVPFVLLLGCPGPEFDTDDTGDTGDTGDTDTDDSDDTEDSGDSDSGDTDSGDTGDTGDTDDSALNWDFEDWSLADPPPGFAKIPTSDWTVAQGADPADGASAASLTLTATGPSRLLAANRGASVPNSGTYRFHAWVHDDDPDVAGRLVVQAFYGANPAGTTEATDPTADGAEWAEYTLDVPVTTAHSLSPRLRVEEVTGGAAGSTLRTDAWSITRDHSFSVGDGIQDAGAVTVADAPEPSMDVSAAMNDEGLLYVATNFAHQDSDHLLFVWIGPPHESETAAPPWMKAGLVAGPSAGGALLVLVQENTGIEKYCEWLVWGGVSWQGAAGDACNGGDDGPRLEGTVDLPAALGLAGPTDVPRELWVSVAPWETEDLGEMKFESQVPAGNGDTLLDPEETIAFSRVGLLLGKLAPAP